MKNEAHLALQSVAFRLTGIQIRFEDSRVHLERLHLSLQFSHLFLERLVRLFRSLQLFLPVLCRFLLLQLLLLKLLGVGRSSRGGDASNYLFLQHMVFHLVGS